MAVDQLTSPGPRRLATPLLSADSHVIEEPSLWEGILPAGYFGTVAEQFHERTGGVDPVARVDEMALDGVDGEVLYPSLGLGLFGLEDAALQQRAFERYNTWLAGFCDVNPERLFGIGLISVYDIDNAVRELERCARLGLRGCEVWQTPHPEFPFTGQHYEPLWQAAAALDMPVSMHILTGFNYSRNKSEILPDERVERMVTLYKCSVTLKLLAVSNSLVEILFSGVLDRHPRLKLVLVENEIGWIPFVLDQFDYYVDRFRKERPTEMGKPPSQYFGTQVFSTFFRDPVGTKLLGGWGVDGCMWSSDYPHPNSTWPHSQQVVADNLGYLDSESYLKITRDNALKLYGITGAGNMNGGKRS